MEVPVAVRAIGAGRISRASSRIRALPPDDRYLAVAVDYLEEGEAGDPEFLEQIRASATSPLDRSASSERRRRPKVRLASTEARSQRP